MKIFVTGGSGLLGQYLNIELNPTHEILTQHNSNPGNCSGFNSIRMKITDYKTLENIFESFRPEIVIHAAAVSNAERVDALPSKDVYEINVDATEHIAQLCEKHHSKLIYLSTDLVYAGDCGSMLKENAKLNPVSLYAETKLISENLIQQTFENYIILREALLIGFGLNHSRNNFHTMFENLKSGKPVNLFIDQFRTPLSLEDAARMIGGLIKKNISGEIINFGGDGRASRYEIGEIVCGLTGFNKNLLIKKTMAEVRLKYPVADVSLNNEKLKSFGVKPLSLRESILSAVTKYGT